MPMDWGPPQIRPFTGTADATGQGSSGVELPTLRAGEFYCVIQVYVWAGNDPVRMRFDAGLGILPTNQSLIEWLYGQRDVSFHGEAICPQIGGVPGEVKDTVYITIKATNSIAYEGFIIFKIGKWVP